MNLVDPLLTHTPYHRFSAQQLPFSSHHQGCLVPVGCRVDAVSRWVLVPKARAFLPSLLFKLAELGIQARVASAGSLRLEIVCVRKVEHQVCSHVGRVPTVHVASFCRVVPSTDGGL